MDAHGLGANRFVWICAVFGSGLTLGEFDANLSD